MFDRERQKNMQKIIKKSAFYNEKGYFYHKKALFSQFSLLFVKRTYVLMKFLIGFLDRKIMVMHYFGSEYWAITFSNSSVVISNSFAAASIVISFFLTKSVRRHS